MGALETSVCFIRIYACDMPHVCHYKPISKTGPINDRPTLRIFIKIQNQLLCNFVYVCMYTGSPAPIRPRPRRQPAGEAAAPRRRRGGCHLSRAASASPAPRRGTAASDGSSATAPEPRGGSRRGPPFPRPCNLQLICLDNQAMIGIQFIHRACTIHRE